MEELRKEPVTAGLILLNILVFLAVEFTGSSQNTMHMLDCGAAYTPMIVQGGEYYRLFTCMFLHFGIEHLLNNMLVLFVLGFPYILNCMHRILQYLPVLQVLCLRLWEQ